MAACGFACVARGCRSGHKAALDWRRSSAIKSRHACHTGERRYPLVAMCRFPATSRTPAVDPGVRPLLSGESCAPPNPVRAEVSKPEPARPEVSKDRADPSTELRTGYAFGVSKPSFGSGMRQLACHPHPVRPEPVEGPASKVEAHRHEKHTGIGEARSCALSVRCGRSSWLIERAFDRLRPNGVGWYANRQASAARDLSAARSAETPSPASPLRAGS